MTTDRAEPQQPSDILARPYMTHHKMNSYENGFADGWNDLRKRLLEQRAASPAPDPAQEAAPVAEIDMRCHCDRCEARTKETYRLKATCTQCGWSGIAIVRKGDKPHRRCRECWTESLTLKPAPPAAPVANGTEGQHRERERLRAIQDHCDNVFGLRAIECENGFRVEYDNVKCRTILKAEIFSMVESINKRVCQGCEGSGLQEEDACTFCWGQGTTTELAPTDAPAAAVADPPMVQLSEMLRGLEIGPEAATWPASMLYSLCQKIAAQAKSAAPPPIARSAADELQARVAPVIAPGDAVATLHVQPLLDEDGTDTGRLSHCLMGPFYTWKFKAGDYPLYPFLPPSTDAAPVGSQQSGSGEATVSDAPDDVVDDALRAWYGNDKLQRFTHTEREAFKKAVITMLSALAAQNTPPASGVGRCNNYPCALPSMHKGPCTSSDTQARAGE